jgi:hypothetical protein
MSDPIISHRALRDSMRASLVAALFVLGACGSSGSDPTPGAGGSSGSSGSAGASGGSSSTGGTTGASGSGGSSAGTAGTGAPAGAGGSSNAGSGGSSGAGAGGSGGSSNAGAAGSSNAGNGGNVGSGGSSGAGAGGSGGSSRGGTSGGSGGRGGSGAGGTAGGGGSATGGSGGSAGCTRELLRSTITAYFTALAAHSASTLPLASNVKFTENGVVRTVGTQGLWMTAGAVKYSQSALDVEICSSATHAVVPEGSMDIAFALRLKLVNQQITEIETIAVRPGDYKLGGASQPLMPSGISAANSTIMWETVPSGQRNTRAELTAWIDKYFRAFPSGVCNTVSSCRRLENGAGNFQCAGGGAGGSCSTGPLPTNPAMVPRILIGDPETGIAVGMTMFMGNTDMHMVKMYGGQVYAVHAVLGGATSSGW